MIQRARVILAAVLLTGLPVRAAGPSLAPFDELMTRFVAENKIPAATLAVARNGRLVYARAFGSGAQPTSLFRIASLSKPITAVAVLHLVEQGKLSLDDPAVKYLEGTPVDPRFGRITIRHLLTHTGGFDRDQSFDPMFRLKKLGATTAAEVVRAMLRRPLDFNPGERFAYSNFGYCVLGRVIERVTGKGYEDYVRAEILAPLGITDTRVGHTKRGDRLANEVEYVAATGNPYGGFEIEPMDSHGGWVASAVDLVRFASAFDEPGRCPVLSAASIRTMFARPGFAGVAKGPVYYACGWQVRELRNGRVNTWHTGLLDGTSTLLVRRWDGLCWAVLFNTDTGPDGRRNLTDKIDPLVHGAADRVAVWPAGEVLGAGK